MTLTSEDDLNPCLQRDRQRALNYCVALSMTLASLETAFEDTAVKNFFVENGTGSREKIFGVDLFLGLL